MATIADLYTGATILLEEADGSYGEYELVQFDYNDGYALLWRNESIGTLQWRATSVAAASSLYQGSDLDTYLTTWYQNLPSSTKDSLSEISYPVASANSSSGSQTSILRYAATVSAYEIGCSNSSNGHYGAELDYYYTSAATSYWTRQPSSGLTRAFYYNIDESVFKQAVVTSSYGVRPTVGIAQDIEVTWDGNLGGYKLSLSSTSTQCTAPAALYLNGGAYNYGQVEPGASFTLSWDAGTGSSITGYAVYYSTSENGTYTWMKDVTGTSTTVYAPDTYSTYRYFKVKTRGSDSSLDSELSTSYRSLWTAADPANVCTAPSTLYLDDIATDITNATPGSTHTLRWTAGTGASISGYAVYYKDTGDTYYNYLGQTTSLSMTVSAPDAYSTTRSFCVSTLSSILGASSDYSSARSITTRAETVNYGVSYYDGTQWLYPTPWYYNGTGWVRPTMWYYDGSTWLPIPPLPKCSYTVEAVSGATYGFALNSDGYYESTNAGVDGSYSLCKVNIVVDGVSNMYVDCINYGESSFDYGILSNVDTTLELSNAADSTNVKQSFSGMQSADVQTVDYGVLTAGEHYIYIKYRKDDSVNSNNDSLQFKVRFV
ncbi:MAG: hypothetical protein IJ444_02065 [Kiritimatiellae bacterium]|nr:hypothetical protein [Kiritimatiellia bacterium]